MHTEISNKLKSTEKEKGVTVLHAVESGSRAWGFASPDSDYDIRFIYKHPQEWYLSLFDKGDVIEFMTVEDFDGSGWDLQKTLKLLAKSNAPLIEWLHSPVVYYQQEEFVKQMRELASECFSPIAVTHHYLSMSKNFIEVCTSEQVKLKSYFYALRCALAGKWIIEERSFPPVAFSELLVIAPLNVRDKAVELMQIKETRDEKYLHPKENLITNYIQETIQFNQEHSGALPVGKKINGKLEDFFRSEISRT